MIADEIHQLIELSDHVQKCKQVIEKAEMLMAANAITMNEVQKRALAIHLIAMVKRSIDQEMLATIDIQLFNEVSELSINIASKICALIPELQDEEKYLLSIHFEAAKLN